MPAQYCVVLITAPDRPSADKIGRGLLEERLAACVNTLPVSSSFWWEGKIDRAEEILLLAKTRADLAAEVAEFVRKHHSYSVPETITLPILSGGQAYLDWIGANTRFTKPKPEPKGR